jgi:hypothetical protein
MYRTAPSASATSAGVMATASWANWKVKDKSCSRFPPPQLRVTIGID